MNHPSLDALTAQSERHATPQTESTNSVRALQTFGQSVWLDGTVAIANAKLAYQRYLALCRTGEWHRLAATGAHPQRLLWASTSTKNPRYRDVRYVEELIGRDTVNTITPATLEAFRDHGRLRSSLEDNVDAAHATIAALERVGISLSDVTDRLLEDGVTLFREAFDSLLAAVDKGRRSEIVGLS